MGNAITKICKVHGELKPEEIYVRSRGGKECKLCQKDVGNKWRLKNKERIMATRIAYRNTENYLGKRRAWYAKNKEREKERRKRWIETNREKHLITRRSYREQNIQVERKRVRDDYKKNIDKRRAASRNRKRKVINNLDDVYIKNSILKPAGFSEDIINDDIIEIKRMQIQLLREAKKKR